MFNYTSSFLVVLFVSVRYLTRGFIFMEEEKIRLGATTYFKGGENFVEESNLFYEVALSIGVISSGIILVIFGMFYSENLLVVLLFMSVLSFSVHGLLVKMWDERYGLCK